MAIIMEFCILYRFRDSMTGSVVETYEVEEDNSYRMIGKRFELNLDAFRTWCTDHNVEIKDLKLDNDSRYSAMYGINPPTLATGRKLTAKWLKEEDVERATW